MSQSELLRFATAIENQPALAERYGVAATPADLAALMRTDGYDITDDEVTELLPKNDELTDQQLDSVAGGYFRILWPGVREYLAAGGT